MVRPAAIIGVGLSASDARIGRVSLSRHQGFIDAPVDVVWELIADVERHPEWWPRVVEVECDGARGRLHLPAGDPDAVRQGRDEAARSTSSRAAATSRIHCLNTGTFVRMRARPRHRTGPSSTAEMGMDPRGSKIEGVRRRSSASASSALAAARRSTALGEAAGRTGRRRG